MKTDAKIDLGYISGVFGLKGWLKVFSYTEPKENILKYSVWVLTGEGQRAEYRVMGGGCYGKGIAVQLKGIQSREEAARFCGMGISILHGQLPSLKGQVYYWVDLVGLQVLTEDGLVLGRVDSLMETGANDVLVVEGERERLIPFVLDKIVRKVDLPAGQVVVSWQPDY